MMRFDRFGDCRRNNLVAALAAGGWLLTSALPATFVFAEPALAQGQTGRVKIPEDFKIVRLRGLELVDDPEGAVVVTRNEKVEVDTKFVAVNGVKVKGAADLMAKLNAADPKTVLITTTRIDKDAAPFYYDYWAETLRYSDVPGGVRIDASGWGEQGNYLTAINGVPMKTAAQVRAMLLDLVNERVPYRSRSTRPPTPKERAAWAKVPSSVPPPIDPALAARWGAFAQLPGKSWYCAASEPQNWLKRQRAAYGEGYGGGVTEARMTVARWVVPDQLMELSNDQGGVRWTDRIQRLPDGRLHLMTTGLRAHTDLVGTLLPDGTVVFRLGTNPRVKPFNATVNFLAFRPLGPKVGSYITNSNTNAYADSSFMSAHCEMEEYDDVKAPRLARNLAHIRESDRQWEASAQRTREYTAQLRAEGAQMLANMQASAMAEIAKIPEVIAETNRREAELNQMRIAAEEETRRKREREAAAARAAENARKVAEANARQQAIADQYAAKRAAEDQAAGDKETQAKRLAEEKQRHAATTRAAEQDASAQADREQREAAAAAEAERRRKAEEQRLAEQKRKQDELNRPIAMKEGVVLCAKKGENYFRCEGPLQVTYSDLRSTAGMTSIKEACGSNSYRDMGMASSFRVFGCGFGINPHSTAPGNRDVPAAYGLFIDGRATFYCPRSKDAYCR